MSKRIRRAPMKQAFEAKHVIVAACAAIAMVLGAMSVGTNISFLGDRQIRSSVTTLADGQPDTNDLSSLNTGGLSRQHTLEVRNFLQQQGSPLYATPGKTLRTNSLSPVVSTSDPVRFMDQMAQPQKQAESATTDTAKDSNPATTSSTTASDPSASPSSTTPASTDTPTTSGSTTSQDNGTSVQTFSSDTAGTQSQQSQ